VLGTLVVTVTVFGRATGVSVPGAGPGASLLLHSIGAVGSLAPFTVFAGGVSIYRRGMRWHGVYPGLATAIMVAGLSYVLLAVASPVLDYRLERAAATPAVVADGRPTGPRTPRAILSQRQHVLANPPDVYSFSVEEPFSQPPNLLTLELHLPLLLAVFSVLNTLLGVLTADLTNGLSPPVRRNLRWAVGLFCGVAFFVAMAAADSWVRSSIEVSGIAGAWLPLAVPLLEAGLLLALIRRRTGLHAQPDSGV
jgi:hypothetical protein